MHKVRKSLEWPTCLGVIGWKFEEQFEESDVRAMGLRKIGSGSGRYMFVYPQTNQYGYFKKRADYNKSGLPEFRN